MSRPTNVDEVEITQQVCEAVADRSDTGPSKLPPLYQVIDPDALAAFLRSSLNSNQPPECTVQFTYNGYRVTIDNTGYVTLHSRLESVEK